MSEVTDILTEQITLKRNTSFLLDGITPSASLEIDRQPAKECRLQVEVAGATVLSGLVNIAGNISETFEFSTNEVKIGLENFTSISGITTSGFDGGSIFIAGLNRIGQPINQEILVEENANVRFYENKGRIVMKLAGQEKIANWKMIGEPDLNILENDLVYIESAMVGITLGKIQYAKRLYDFDGITHHVEAEIIDL